MYWHIFLINVWPGDGQVLQQISQQQEQFIRCWRSLQGSWPMYPLWRLRLLHRQGALANELHSSDATKERSYEDVEGPGFPREHDDPGLLHLRNKKRIWLPTSSYIRTLVTWVMLGGQDTHHTHFIPNSTKVLWKLFIFMFI